jgi:predicted DNA-binding transcriptional regulator AlpA
MARPEIRRRNLLSREDLQARGIRFSRVHLHRLERASLFPQHVKIGAGNFIAWFEDEIDAYLDRLAAARTKHATAKTTTTAATAALSEALSNAAAVRSEL